MSTRQKIRSGLKWVSLSLVAMQVVRFSTTVVLARLLVPEMFGLVAMANAIIDLIGVIRELGFGSAFIQRQTRDPGDERLAANTAFYLLLGINAALFAAAWLFAPVLAGLFKGDGLELVLRVMFVAFLIDGLGTLPTFKLRKDLEFGRHAASQAAGAVVHSIVAIGLAFSGGGVWSLVAGHLSSRLVQTGMAYALLGWRPRLEFSRRIAWELFSFGRYLWAFAVLSAVGRNLDRLIIGSYLGAAPLGVYGLAFQLCRLPSNLISRLVNRITFPALARVQDDPAALRSGFLKTLKHVSIVSLPIAFGLLAVAEDFVPTVYGDKWAGAVPVIRVLGFFGMALSVSSITGPVFTATGRPQVLLYTSVVHQLLLAGLLAGLARFGVLGVAYAVLIPILVSSAIAFTLIQRQLGLRATALLGPLVRAGLASAGMWVGVELLQLQLRAFEWTPPAILGCSVALGGVSYLAFTALLNRAALVEVTRTLLEVVSSGRRPRSEPAPAE